MEPRIIIGTAIACMLTFILGYLAGWARRNLISERRRRGLV